MQQCNKGILIGLGVLVCVIIGVIVYCTWTGGDQETTMDVTGNKNVVMASEKREISLLHIEGLASAQRVSNWLTFCGFLTLLVIMGYAGFHYKVIRAPRRMRKDMEREKIVDRLHDIEEVLVELGHMRKKRALKMRKNKEKKGRGIKKTQKQDMEEKVDSDDFEEA